MPKLPHGTLPEVAAFAGVSPQYAGRIANGRQDWRKARPALIRALYVAGWRPKDGAWAVRHWLARLSLPS